MREFCCGDIVPGCSAKFQGQTDEEVLGQVAAHARDEHGMSEVPDEVVAQVKARIHPVVEAPA